MERLQKALQQAREHRAQSVATESTSVVEDGTAHARKTGFEAAWDALEQREPDKRRLSENLMVSLSAQHTATPFDVLRTKTQLIMKKNGWTRLAITSPTAACGKTTMACNLALGFTRQSDMRVILLEMDLRRPSMAKTLGIRPERDITDVMTGAVDFRDQAFRLRDNVAISMASGPASDPSAVLLHHKTKSVLTDIEYIYQPDLVIFDLPPILVTEDTRAFLKDVDCALIVAKAEATSIAQIDVSEREVSEHTNVLGVVLNQCRHVSDTDYGYESYYGEAS